MSSIRVHSLIHARHEGNGSILDWIESHGYQHTSTNFFSKPTLPSQDDFDMLIIMGGPMSVNDEAKHPWLKREKEFIRESIEGNKIVAGICLGSQLIANSLGAKVKENEEKEIGWHPVYLTGEAISHPLFSNIPPEFVTFQWHGDTFDIPDQALKIAYSEACSNQGFIYRDNVLAMQFHPEIEEQLLRNMVDKGAGELVAGKYVQTAGGILDNLDNAHENTRMLYLLLDRLIQRNQQNT
jgi:GMP synthase-like glutamine amidotransferase